MKILHVISNLNPASGGPPRIALRLAASTASLGHDVTILYHNTPQARSAIDQQLAEIPNSNLVHHEVLPLQERLGNLYPRKVRQAMARMIDNFDIVHIHSIWDGISRAAMAKAHQHGIPFVILANGMLDPWSLQQKRRKKQLFLWLGLRRLMNYAAFFQAGNLDEKQGFINAGITTPIEIIPNGIDPKQFETLPPPGQFFASHPALKNRPYIVFMGRLHHKKGLDFLAAAFTQLAPQLPDVQLVVAGPDDGARADFESDIALANLTDRTHILGPLFGPDRFTLLRDAAVFTLPSRQEGFSVAILEAMACAVPVVISEPCHFPQVAERGAGIVIPLNVPDLVAALQIILSNPQTQKTMADAARTLVLEQFTWPQIAQQMIAAYQRVIKK